MLRKRKTEVFVKKKKMFRFLCFFKRGKLSGLPRNPVHFHLTVFSYILSKLFRLLQETDVCFKICHYIFIYSVCVALQQKNVLYQKYLHLVLYNPYNINRITLEIVLEISNVTFHASFQGLYLEMSV